MSSSTPPSNNNDINGSKNNTTNTDSPDKSPRNGLVQSFGDAEGITGAICNDQNGLCLGSRGAAIMDEAKSGVFTSLVKLASKLDPGSEPPLIAIETEESVLLIKEYDGHAVALRRAATGNDASGTSIASKDQAS
jgi:hepatitis B virus X-interacting protein